MYSDKAAELIQECADPQELAQQIVGETIVAILATDTRGITYTTYDQDQIQGIISRVIDQVRKHWEFK